VVEPEATANPAKSMEVAARRALRWEAGWEGHPGGRDGVVWVTLAGNTVDAWFVAFNEEDNFLRYSGVHGTGHGLHTDYTYREFLPTYGGMPIVTFRVTTRLQSKSNSCIRHTTLVI
jgi:hypothetical protein